LLAHFMLECYRIKSKRVVAQLGSALDWGSRGRWFKSSPPDQNFSPGIFLAFLYIEVVFQKPV
jgi:hypothetical protein